MRSKAFAFTTTNSENVLKDPQVLLSAFISRDPQKQPGSLWQCSVCLSKHIFAVHLVLSRIWAKNSYSIVTKNRYLSQCRNPRMPRNSSLRKKVCLGILCTASQMCLLESWQDNRGPRKAGNPNGVLCLAVDLGPKQLSILRGRGQRFTEFVTSSLSITVFLYDLFNFHNNTVL